MARTKYTVTFPAAKAGDEVTWPNSVKVYADANIDRPLGNGYIEAAAGSFTGWSDAASVTFTRAGTSDSVTVTTGSPTGTGAAVPSAASSVAVKDEGSTVVATASALNFVGAGVTASDGGSGTATVTIPGGGTTYTTDAQANGVKIDGKTVSDAAITSGQPTLTSATAAFTNADTGKTFMVAGAGASGRELVATGTYVNATTMTLASNAGTTVSGARLTYGTDDTAAWQALINAALASQYTSVTITAKAGITVLASAQHTGTVTGVSGAFSGNVYPYSGQLLLPAREFGFCPTVRIQGPTPPPFAMGYITEGAHQTGLIFRSTAGNTAGANIIDVIPSQNGYLGITRQGGAPQSDVELRLQNVTLRVCVDPLNTGISADALGRIALDDVTVDVDSTTTTASLPVTGTTNTGIILPGYINFAHVSLRRVQCYGYPVGIDISEHAVLDNVYTCNCLVGYQVSGGTHAAAFVKVLSQRCRTILKANTARAGTTLAMIYGILDYEDQSLGSTGYVIDDASNLLRGQLMLHNGNSSTVEPMGAATNGGLNLDLSRPWNGGSGWKALRLKDMMTRDVDLTGGMGSADQSAHPYFTWTGTFHTSAGKALASATANQSSVAGVQGKSNTPTIAATIVTGTGAFNYGLAFRITDGSNYLIAALAPAGISIQKRVSGTYTSLAADGVALSTSTTYSIVVTVKKATPIAATVITVYKNGASAVTYTLSGPEEAAFTASGLGLFGFADGTSGCTYIEELGNSY